MNISAQGEKFIKENEGLNLTAYADGAGLTVGYGHQLDADQLAIYGKSITRETAQMFFDSDVATRVDALNSALKIQVNQTLFDALIDFGFSMSPASLAKSSVVALINSGATEKEIKNRWLNSYVKFGNDLHFKVLVDRRKREVDLAYSGLNEYFSTIGVHYMTPLESFSIGFVLVLILLVSLYYTFKK